MSNNKQSSVELLFHKLWDTPKDKFTWYVILEEHKAMHKEEIKNAFTNGFISSRGSNRIADEIFYNETFGGNNE